MIEIVRDDLFASKEKYLCHQCNCVTNRAAHLSKAVFERYPYADIYAARKDPSEPGTIEIRGNGQDKRYVVNMLGQFFPGTPKFPDSTKDGTKVREKYFYKCLLALAKIPDLESVAFPYKIGCGAAGGNWDHYLGNIENFAKYVSETQGTIVKIYQLPE